MNARALWKARKLGLPQPTAKSTLLANIFYEYAGFTFAIMRDDGGFYAVAAPGQHPAAYKDKHARAAMECWVNSGRPGL